MSPAEIVLLLKAYQELKQSHEDLARRVAWFEHQLFGAKSERRLVDSGKTQLALGEIAPAQAADVRTTEVAAHRRRQPARSAEVDDHELRFDDSVPVEEIVLDEQKDPAEYAAIGEKVTCRLAQRPGAYVVLRYVRKVYKRRADGAFSCPPAPPAVFEKSCADVSFLAGVVIDKFNYHLPLYRQHQRLAAAGVHLARSTLTNYVHRVGAMLEPIQEAQLESILASGTLAMDETPIKAGRKKGTPPRRGQMKTGYFWPIYGDRDEIAFLFAPTRGSEVVRTALKDFKGVMLTDGYKVYELFAQAESRVVHAQCWAHARRHFAEAEGAVPRQAGAALDLMTEIYSHEDRIRQRGFSPEQVVAYRGEHVKPLVDRFFEDLRKALREEVFLPTNPFTKAARYALDREAALRVFLQYPDVALDTNHVERAIRPIALGRKNFLFCWTEVGAQYVGILQSLLSTCRIQGIDPYVYLVDVLQRIDHHPAKDVALLTPRLWKEHFAAHPMRSHIDRT